MSPTRLVVLGDAMLDRDLDGTVDRLAPDAPVPVVDDPVARSRPGGAALAAVLAARDGHDVELVTALGRDTAGRQLATMLSEAGVHVEDVGLGGGTPEKVRILARGRPMMRVDRGAPVAPPGPLTSRATAALRNATAVLVSDYGRGITADGGVRRALAGLPARTPMVWDPHPRGAVPVGPVTLATPNQHELAHFTASSVSESIASIAAAAQALARCWHVTVCVTCGARGALATGAAGTPIVVPARRVSSGDSCGAGDRFAAAAASALSAGAVVSEAVDHAVIAATRFVATGGAASIGVPEHHDPPRSGEPERVAQQVRERGGTVVATGGCFDLLHAGHLATLQAARQLGDCLVVLLNSDSSVRRLKGPDRPLQPQADRSAVLRGLSCVDAVEVFDEETPVRALARLRPHVFAKGGDYTHAELPEEAVLDGWGGQAVVLPYLPGRSTTRLLEEARHRG
jgi:rfaE bifunctional protein nucleotidyltransferase chain/domain/rfaE bifunctional protein kinase chain/domain